MTSGAGLDVESATFLRQLDMLVDEFRKPLTPIGGDVEIVKEGEFFFGLLPHETFDHRGHRGIRTKAFGVPPSGGVFMRDQNHRLKAELRTSFLFLLSARCGSIILEIHTPF